MKLNGVEDVATAYRIAPAAGEELIEMVDGLDGPARSQAGWDPYEVWWSRVKGSSSVMQERRRGPSRWWLRFALLKPRALTKA